MVITRNFKLMVAILGLLIFLSVGIYKDKIVLAFIFIVGLWILAILVKNPVRLIYVQIIYNYIIKFAIQIFNIPSWANYATDLLTVLIVIAAIKEILTQEKKSNMKLPIAIVFFFLLTTVIGLIINGQSILLYIWGIRNNFRFYGFLFGCVVFLKKKDIDLIFKTTILISFVNLMFCAVQYFVFGISQDSLGGIFGTNVGVNIYLNVFICITTLIALVQFEYKKMSTSIMLFIIFSNLCIAAVGEIKIFFLELIVIVAATLIFSKPSKKTFFLLIFCVIGVYFGIQLFYKIFPQWQSYFSIEKIISSNQTYATVTDLGRLTATQRITSMFLSGDISKILFGIGLGSAETSQIPMFTSQFYYDYGTSLHYTWLSQAFILLENGWVGLVCFFGFFVSIVGSCFKIRKRKKEYFDYCVITQVSAILCCLFAIYNSTLRTEAAYFIYLMLSLPFALYRNEEEFNNIKVEID